jgi:lysozyme
MKTSAFGIKAIAKREGTILHVYKDSKGLPTAGVGHLITAAEKAEYPVGKHITQAQSDNWLAVDLKECEDAVNSLGVSLKQNEFDALVSLTFNIGVAGFKRSTVARRLRAGDKKGAAEAILMWNKPPEIQGRRRTEYNQFLTPYKVSAAVPDIDPQSNGAVSDATSNPLSDSPIQPPITTAVEQTETKATDSTGDQTTATETKVTATIPKGDHPEAAPTQVSKNGPLAKWIAGGGGLGALGTLVWGYIQSNPSAVGIGIICGTALIIAIIYRGAITDAIRMQIAADPDKKNVT